MKIYLKEFCLLGTYGERDTIDTQRRTCYNNFYPFFTLPGDFTTIDFSPITVFYGGNGSGKSTILNVIAEKLHMSRKTKFNRTHFFSQYVDACTYSIFQNPEELKIITSDDIFKKLFLTRARSDEIEDTREEMLVFHKRCAGKYAFPGSESIDEVVGKTNLLKKYDELHMVLEARRGSASSFAGKYAGKSIIGNSNGEEALEYFYDEIKEPGLYLLDEPENSLSAVCQKELSDFLFSCARFYGAQIVIATHSPFILSIPEAKIYNLDTNPVSVTYDWTSLDNMKEFYMLFHHYRNSFEKE